MRLCVLAPGASVHTRRWIVAMSGRGHDLLLITQDVTPPLPAEVFDPYQAMGVLARVPKVRACVAERLILARVRHFSPDIVHLHWLNPSLGTLRIIRRMDPLVISVWGGDVIWDGGDPEPRMRVYYKRRILRCAREVTATSRFLAQRTGIFLPPGKSPRVIPFGVDCERFRPSKDAHKGPVPVVGFLKHFTAKYGPDVLLRAAALMASHGREFRVEMYGTKDPLPYRRLAHELGLEGRVTIAGAVDHDRVPEILGRFDVFAMPSVYDSETFGVAALEASACGIPVVASRVGGVPEIVDHEVSGLLVPPSDPPALAQALSTLIGDRALRCAMGDAGRRLVLRSYRWEECVEGMEDVYRGLKRTAGAMS